MLDSPQSEIQLKLIELQEKKDLCRLILKLKCGNVLNNKCIFLKSSIQQATAIA